MLESFELEMSTLRAEEALPTGRFGPAHYRAVHRHLFQDVYAGAGRYRTVRTAKDGNWFCFPENIRAEMNRLFQRLGQTPFVESGPAGDFVLAAADFLAELNAVHPFRDGNRRAQLAFLHLVALRSGHPLRLETVRHETFMPAIGASFGGRLELLAEELKALLA